MNNSEDSRSTERPLPMLEIRSAIRPPGDKRKPIKHILIGAPEIVSFTTRRLEQLGYAQVNDWARPIDLTEPLNIVPDPGDVIDLLVRYLSLQ